MAEVKLTKTELRLIEKKKKQLLTYLPTLKLKKSRLQVEAMKAKDVYRDLEMEYEKLHQKQQSVKHLFSTFYTIEWEKTTIVKNVQTEVENLAGIELPTFLSCDYESLPFFSYEMPVWIFSAIELLREKNKVSEKLKIAQKRYELVNEELRAVNIKVNLFEKRLIPQTRESIKKIKIFLGDQELAQVGRAKVAKKKKK